MLSKKNRQYISSLKVKKYRQKYSNFLVEGDKMVRELLSSKLDIKQVFALSSWIERNNLDSYLFELQEVTDREIKQISNLKTPNQVIAIASIPTINKPINDKKGFYLALDHIQDPGNLGTIIRTADWFGIDTIFCSTNCVDAYSPKVVQATMGSIFRVNIVYMDLKKLFNKYANIPVYGALLDGKNIFETGFTSTGFLLVGNESKGIDSSFLSYIQHPITIPQKGRSESLNAAVATGIICSIVTNYEEGG